jgi:heme-degrading monooxygenase HmoA
MFPDYIYYIKLKYDIIDGLVNFYIITKILEKRDMMGIATTPTPPYYAVIFSSERTEENLGYDAMGEKMVQLASEQPGFLGVESARDTNGFGITISYWESREAIQKWKAHYLHQLAQERGRVEWYLRYKTRICLVERDYGYERNDDPLGTDHH